jgi:hypothetical protein
MNSITITRSDKKSLNLFGKKKISFGLPESWDEVPADIRMEIFRALHFIAYPQNFEYIIKKIADPDNIIFLGTPKEQLWELYDTLSWMKDPPGTTPIIDHFEYKGVTYHFPKPMLENASGYEFAVAEEIYPLIQGDTAEENLLKLTATICRPADPDKAAVIANEDIRIPLYNKEERDLIARDLQGLDPAVQHIAFLYFTACKEFIHELYGPFIFTGDSPDDVSKMLGWYGTFFSIAETGIFGKLDQVFQTKLHTLLQYLMKAKADTDRIKNSSPNKPADHD